MKRPESDEPTALEAFERLADDYVKLMRRPGFLCLRVRKSAVAV